MGRTDPVSLVAPLLADLAEAGQGPEGGPGSAPRRTVSAQDVAGLAQQTGLSPRQVEMAVLELGVAPLRYARNLACLSMDDQRCLLGSCVALAGLGGLGGLVLESLARLGVGRIRACDGDAFEESNANRQVLAVTASMGRPKAEAALARAREVNPSVEVEACSAFLDEKGFRDLVAGADAAVDALGGLDDRSALRRAAAEAGVPLVTAAVAGWSGSVAVIMPGQASPAPAQALVRGRAPAPEDVLGTPAPTAYTAASLQCAEVARLLLGQAPALAGRLLLFDLADMTFDLVVLDPAGS